MALSTCGKFIKYTIFVVNFLIFLAGITFLSLVAWRMANYSSPTWSKGFQSWDIAFLVFGGIITILSFLGCCGAIKEVKCLLMTFFIVNLLLLIFIVGGIIIGYSAKDELDKAFEKEIHDSINETQDESWTEFWNISQKQLKCCGSQNFTDWLNFGLNVPESCNCNIQEDRGNQCLQFQENGEKRWVFQDGCYEKIKNALFDDAKPLLATGIVIVTIIVLAMVFSCSLFLML